MVKGLRFKVQGFTLMGLALGCGVQGLLLGFRV